MSKPLAWVDDSPKRIRCRASSFSFPFSSCGLPSLTEAPHRFPVERRRPLQCRWYLPLPWYGIRSFPRPRPGLSPGMHSKALRPGFSQSSSGQSAKGRGSERKCLAMGRMDRVACRFRSIPQYRHTSFLPGTPSCVRSRIGAPVGSRFSPVKKTEIPAHSIDAHRKTDADPAKFGQHNGREFLWKWVHHGTGHYA